MSISRNQKICLLLPHSWNIRFSLILNFLTWCLFFLSSWNILCCVECTFLSHIPFSHFEKIIFFPKTGTWVVVSRLLATNHRGTKLNSVICPRLRKTRNVSYTVLSEKLQTEIQLMSTFSCTNDIHAACIWSLHSSCGLVFTSILVIFCYIQYIWETENIPP